MVMSTEVVSVAMGTKSCGCTRKSRQWCLSVHVHENEIWPYVIVCVCVQVCVHRMCVCVHVCVPYTCVCVHACLIRVCVYMRALYMCVCMCLCFTLAIVLSKDLLPSLTSTHTSSLCEVDD